MPYLLEYYVLSLYNFLENPKTPFPKLGNNEVRTAALLCSPILFNLITFLIIVEHLTTSEIIVKGWPLFVIMVITFFLMVRMVTKVIKFKRITYHPKYALEIYLCYLGLTFLFFFYCVIGL